METEKKKALLIVAGGRGTPDFAALECIKPNLVVILTTHEGWGEEQNFRLVVQTLPDQEPTPPTIRVASYSFEETEKQCFTICKEYPSTIWDWTFSIGSCPKIMGIAAYEVAKQMSIPCIHVDTQHEKIISLIKDIGVSAHDFFGMNVKTYMSIYGREPDDLQDGEIKYRADAEKWGHIANIMALSSDTYDFVGHIQNKEANKPIGIPSSLVASRLLQDLERHMAIQLTSQPDGTPSCVITTKHFAKFLQGGWLEIYVWQAAKATEITSDCQWGYRIKSTAAQELDMAFTYKAQLIFAECKTNKNPFEKKIHFLDTISSKADMLGRNYVTKIFVTNGSKTLPGYRNFAEQAKLRRIVVATAEDLPTLKDLLEKQAKNPDYPRT